LWDKKYKIRIRMNIILLIMNCEKYGYKREKQTWVKNIKIPYYYVIGNPKMKNKEYEIIDNILYLKCEDDYNSLPKKVIMAYEIIIKLNPLLDYILKTDDDQELINMKFMEIIMGILETRKYNYGGQIVDIKIPYLSKYYKIHETLPKDMIMKKCRYCTGRFYFLSKEAIKKILEKKKEIEKEYIEDYAIGYNLCEKNILNIMTNKYFVDYIY